MIIIHISEISIQNNNEKFLVNSIILSAFLAYRGINIFALEIIIFHLQIYLYNILISKIIYYLSNKYNFFLKFQLKIYFLLSNIYFCDYFLTEFASQRDCKYQLVNGGGHGSVFEIRAGSIHRPISLPFTLLPFQMINAHFF